MATTTIESRVVMLRFLPDKRGAPSVWHASVPELPEYLPTPYCRSICGLDVAKDIGGLRFAAGLSTDVRVCGPCYCAKHGGRFP